MADIGILKGKAMVAPFNAQYECWIVLAGSAKNARIYVKSQSDNPLSVDFESGPDNDPANLDTAGKVTKVIAQKRVVDFQALPVPPSAPGDPYYYYTRVRADGLVELEVASEIDVTVYTRKRPELES